MWSKDTALEPAVRRAEGRGGSVRVFILHQNNLFRDVVSQELSSDEDIHLIGATDSHMQASRWVDDEGAGAAIVELDPGVATEDELRELFATWREGRERFVVVGANLSQSGVDLYVHRASGGSGVRAALHKGLDLAWR